MRGVVRTARAPRLHPWHVLIVAVLLVAAVVSSLFLPHREAKAGSPDHAPPGAQWGQHLRPTPNVTPTALPPMIHGLQPVPLPDGRTVLLHLPPRSDVVHPLIFALHGLYNTTTSIENTSGFDALADQRGYLIAYGEGLYNSWNAGSCCGTAASTHVDDVDYLAEAVTAISAHFAVDQARIVVTGFSNGGMLAFRAACERPGLFRAALTVAGTLVSPCPNPVTVIHVHGLVGHHCACPRRLLRLHRHQLFPTAAPSPPGCPGAATSDWCIGRESTTGRRPPRASTSINCSSNWSAEPPSARGAAGLLLRLQHSIEIRPQLR